MTTFEVYWLTRLDSINGLLFAVAIISAILCAMGTLFIYIKGDVEDDKDTKLFAAKWGKNTLLIAGITGALSVFVPTTKELVAIYGISYLTQNKDAREIPAAALKVLNKELQDLAGEDKDKD